jgi:hypothetical protein
MANKRNIEINPRYATGVEIDTGQIWVDGKTIFRRVINFGALPNGTTKSVAHGITGLDLITGSRLHAKRTDINYQRTLVDGSLTTSTSGGADLYIDNTSIYFATVSNWSDYNVAYWIVEYTKV